MADPTLEAYRAVAGFTKNKGANSLAMAQAMGIDPKVAALGSYMGGKSELSDSNYLGAIDAKTEGRRSVGKAETTQKNALTRFMNLDPEVAKIAAETVEANPAIQEQEEAVKNQKNALQRLMKLEGNVPVWAKADLTMPLAFFDEMNKTNYAKHYKPYQSPAGVITNAQSSLASAEGKLAANKIQLLKQFIKDKEQNTSGVGLSGSREAQRGLGGAGSGQAKPMGEGARINAEMRGAQLIAKETSGFSKAYETLKILGDEIDLAKSEKEKSGSNKLDIAGFGPYESTIENPEVTGILAKGINVAKTMMGGKPAEWANRAQRNRAAAKDLLSTVTKIYSGAQASDKEAIRLATTLAQESGVTDEQFAQTYSDFVKKFGSDFEQRLNIIKSSDFLSKQWDKVGKTGGLSPKDYAELVRKSTNGGSVSTTTKKTKSKGKSKLRSLLGK